MRSKYLIAAAVVAPLALAIGSAANATDLVVNGGFENTTYGTTSSQFGAGYGGQGVTGWTGGSVYGADAIQMWFYGPTANSVSANTQWTPPDYGNHFYPTMTPIDGSFVALDGDPGDPSQGVGPREGSISQTINGLEVGKVYTLTFDWAAAQLANRTGTITESLQVSIGNDLLVNTPTVTVLTGEFSGWMTQSYTFTASQTSEVLTFLSMGTPTGLPPMALLDDVSITVPEPASWAMMILGFGAIGFAMRRRTRMALA
jgi:hypothetical protein